MWLLGMAHEMGHRLGLGHVPRVPGRVEGLVRPTTKKAGLHHVLVEKKVDRHLYTVTACEKSTVGETRSARDFPVTCLTCLALARPEETRPHMLHCETCETWYAGTSEEPRLLDPMPYALAETLVFPIVDCRGCRVPMRDIEGIVHALRAGMRTKGWWPSRCGRNFAVDAVHPTTDSPTCLACIAAGPP